MIKTRPSLVRAVSLAAFSASLVGLAGCNPIGGGTGPTDLRINAPDGTANAATGVVYGCIRTGLTASLFFENGTAADFTQRVTWSIAEIDQPALSITNFTSTATSSQAGGVLTPGSIPTGTQRVVRVTAQFSGLTDFIDITVNPEPELTLMQRNIGTNLPEALPAGTVEGDPAVRSRLRIAPQTSVDFQVMANLGGRPTRVDSAANWSFGTTEAGAPITEFRDAPDASGVTRVIASITQDGVVAASTVNVPVLTARAAFTPTCSQSLAAQVTVSPVRSVRLVPQFGAQTLIVPNTERYKVLAGFDEDGLEQDVSPFSALTSSDINTANFIGSLLGIPSLLSSVAAGGPITLTVTTPAVVAATPPATTPVRNAPTIQQTVVADTLVSIALEPATLSAVTGSGTVCPTRVVGTYTSGAQQDITRRATFLSSDTTTAIVSSIPLTAGQVGSAGLVPGTATITATVPSSTATPFTATTVFTSVAPSATDPGPICNTTFAPLPGQVPAAPAP